MVKRLTSEQLKELEVAALSMGYRRLRPDKLAWTKPFAYSLLCIDGDKPTPEFYQAFRSAKDNSIGFWKIENFTFGPQEEYGSILQQIKHYECYSTHQFSATDGDFHFLDLGEEAQAMGWL